MDLNKNNIFILKIRLGSKYRILAVPEDYTLYELANAIIKSFGFDFDHSFGFYGTLGMKYLHSKECYESFVDDGEESECKSVKKTKINKAFDKIGKKMLFLFDYGDNWRFTVELQNIEPMKLDIKYPFVVESKGGVPKQYRDIE